MSNVLHKWLFSVQELKSTKEKLKSYKKQQPTPKTNAGEAQPGSPHPPSARQRGSFLGAEVPAHSPQSHWELDPVLELVREGVGEEQGKRGTIQGSTWV